MSKLIVNYKLLDPVGSGQYGKVYKAENIDDKQFYAAKVIPREMIEGSPKLKECIINEINMLTKIHSEYVIKFIEMHKTQNNAYLIYEFCDGGTLEKAMFENGYFREKEAMEYFKQLVKGFQAIEEVMIIHRDLKPQNILLQMNKVKIADFGFCKPLKSKNELTSTVLGSPIYMAPEIMRGEKYGMKSDIWSLGIVLYEILIGICPYEGTSLENMLELINSGSPSFPSRFGISENVQKLIGRMLDSNQNSRISWQELIELYGNKSNLTPQIDFDFSKQREATAFPKRPSKTPDVSPEKLVNISPQKLHHKSPSPRQHLEPFSKGSQGMFHEEKSSNFTMKVHEANFKSEKSLLKGLFIPNPVIYSTKNSILLSLVHYRNRILFGFELAMNLLNSSLNQNQLLARNVISILLKESGILISELQKPFGGVFLSKISISRTEITDSIEFQNLISNLKKEAELLTELSSEINLGLGFSNSFSALDYNLICKELFEFGRKLISRNELDRNFQLLANQVFDVLLIHDIFERILEFDTSYESQIYFARLKIIGFDELSDLVGKKERYLAKIIV